MRGRRPAALSRVLPLGGGRVLALVLDPGDRSTMDGVTTDCRILQRLAAVVTDAYPQVVVLERTPR